MQGLGKIITGIAIVSVLFLLYVQGQISLLRVSYLLDIESKKLFQKEEEYRYLLFEIDQLKAPRRLEEKIKDLQLNLTLPNEIRVVRVPATPPLEKAKIDEVQLQPLSKGLLDFLGHWVKVAQAKTDSDSNS